MKDNEHDELWDLLGKARTPKERPFFAAKVMQAVREVGQGSETVGFWAMIRRRWILPLAGCSAALVAVFFALNQPAPNTVTNVGPAIVPNADPLAPLVGNTDIAAELPAALDNFLATQDNAVWLQADPSSLYP